MKLTFLFLFTIFILLLIPFSGYGEFSKNIETKKLEPKLEKMMLSNPEEKVRVTIFLNEKNYSNLNLTSNEIIYKFDEISAVTVYASLKRLKEIEKLPQTEKIVLDKKAYISRSTAVPLIKADVANALGYNGTGINISIIDTGVFNHTEFTNPNKLISQKCYCVGCCPPNNVDENSNATDDNGHGTHVAGISAGKLGVANGSSIIAVKVLDSSGGGYDSDVAKGIEWAFQNGANVISLSLGGCVNNTAALDSDCYDSCYDSPTSRMVENAIDNNTVVIVAAGNCGGSGVPTTQCPEGKMDSYTIGWPACAKGAITVGATNNVDNRWTFSSAGPTDIDNRTKPDLTAPGVSINSTINSVNGYSNTYTGTSMSTPFVSGVAALLIQKYNQTFGYFPEPARVKTILLTAVNTTGMNAASYTQRNNLYGSGRIDANETLIIVNYTKNDTIQQNQQKTFYLNVTSTNLKVTLNWPENSTTYNHLALILEAPNSTNYTNPSNVNDTIEQRFFSDANTGIWKAIINGTVVNSTQSFYLASNTNFITQYTTVESPANTTYNQSTIHFNITVYETLTNTFVSINNTANNTMKNDTLYHYYNTTLTLPDGHHNATFYVNNSYGTISSTIVYFSVDATKPLIQIQSPQNTTYNQQNISLNFTVTDNSSISWCGYSLDSQSNTTLTSCTNRTLTNLSESSHNITLYANDSVGNMNSSMVNFTIKIPPRYFINGTNDTDNIIGKFDSILLFVNWTDETGLGFAWLETNESGAAANKTGIYGSPFDINLTSGQTWSNFTWSNSSVAAGTVIQWKIFANDTNGNENVTSTGIFSIDNSTPTYSNLLSTPAIYNQTFQTNATWQDNVNISTVIFEANFTSTSTNYTVTTRSGNEYYFTILYGNQTTNKFVVYRWYVNDTSNLWNSTNQLNYTVIKAPTLTRLFLNGTESSKNYQKGSIANITATLNITGKNVTILANFSGTVTLANSTSPQQNATNTSSLNISAYNITAYFSEDENYTASNVSYNIYVLKLDGESCSSASECFGGYCNSGICTSSAPPTTATSSSYAGGSIVTIEKKTEVKISATQANITIPSIAAGKSENTSISNFSVREVFIEVKNPVNNVKITVEKISIKPVEVTTPSDIVSHYLRIDKQNITDNDINKTKIKFTVEKSWIITNDINESTITLQRYANNQWNKLTTTKVSENQTEAMYQAESLGLSIFAVTGELKLGLACPACPSAGNWIDCVNNTQTRTNYRCSNETNYQCQVYNDTRTCGTENPKEEITKLPTKWLIIVVSIGVIGVFVWKKYKKRLKKLYKKYKF